MLSRHPLRAGLSIPVAIALLAASACGNGNSGSGGGSGGKTILIGEVVGATGAYAVIGENMINAGKLAVAQINASGGLNGSQVAIQSYDDQGNPTLGAQLVQKLVSAGAVAIVGSGDTGPATAAESTRLGVPDIGIVDGGGPTVYPNGPGTAPLKWIFEYSTSTYELGAKLATYGLAHCTKLAVLHDQTSYGEGASQAISFAYKTAGKELALNDTISENWSTSTTVDVAPEVRRVQSSGADCVVPWLSPENAARFVQTVKSLGGHFTLLTNDASYGDTVYPKLAGAAADGSISAELSALVNPNAGLQSYQQKYQAQFNAPPDIYGEQTYDSIMMLAQAIRSTHSTNPATIRDALEKMTNYQGITGILGFSASQHESIGPESLTFIRLDAASGKWNTFTP